MVRIEFLAYVEGSSGMCRALLMVTIQAQRWYSSSQCCRGVLFTGHGASPRHEHELSRVANEALAQQQSYQDAAISRNNDQEAAVLQAVIRRGIVGMLIKEEQCKPWRNNLELWSR